VPRAVTCEWRRVQRLSARPLAVYAALGRACKRRSRAGKPRRSCCGGGLVEGVQDATRALQESFSGRQKAHATGGAREERRANLCFERLDLAADRGLRDVQFFRGAAHVSFFCNGNEVADLREAHGGSIPKRYWIGERCLCMVLAWVSKS